MARAAATGPVLRYTRRALRKLWQRWVLDVRERADASIEPGGDPRAVVVLVTAMLCLWLIRFVGMPYEAARLLSFLSFVGLDALSESLAHALQESPSARLNALVYWSLWRLAGYVVIPAAVVVLVLRERLSGFGLRIRGTSGFAGIYLGLIAALMPFVVLASYAPEFQASYPFYPLQPGEALWPAFWMWEVLYALQFVSLEFFFRGFLLHGLQRRFGYMSIFVMVGLYMMIHFQKPAAEAMGSIVAGFVLGTLALECRSIWWGALAHVTVALSMDFLSLWHRGLL